MVIILPDDTKEAYDLSNNIKVPRKKRRVLTTSTINYFRERFSVLSVLSSLFKLKIFDNSHHCRKELTVHRDSMIEVIIPEIYFIMFHRGISSWFISRDKYSSNTRAFFIIVEKYFNLRNEITVQMENELCSMKTGVSRKNNKYVKIWRRMVY